MHNKVISALMIAWLLAEGCGDVEYDRAKTNECHDSSDCCYPCEYCEGGLCKVNEGIEKESECLYAKRWTCQYR